MELLIKDKGEAESKEQVFAVTERDSLEHNGEEKIDEEKEKLVKETDKEKENSDICELLEYLDSPPFDSSITLDPKTCSAREYVIHFIFPILLPALNKMLSAAIESQALERRRTRFNACDFITEYLYRHNPKYSDRSAVDLDQIPFVQEILKRNPRPPLPLSLIWSEEEAAVVIQSFWRGYLVRKDEEVQELRLYQREMRMSSYHIMFQVEDFWKKHPVEEEEHEEEEKEETTEKRN